MVVGNHLVLAREMGSNDLTGLLCMRVERNFYSSGNIKKQKGARCSLSRTSTDFLLLAKGKEGLRTLGIKGINEVTRQLSTC